MLESARSLGNFPIAEQRGETLSHHEDHEGHEELPSQIS
jgi:hypothetical protein